MDPETARRIAQMATDYDDEMTTATRTRRRGG
jgi:hypothetical protein